MRPRLSTSGSIPRGSRCSLGPTTAAGRDTTARSLQYLFRGSLLSAELAPWGVGCVAAVVARSVNVAPRAGGAGDQFVKQVADGLERISSSARCNRLAKCDLSGASIEFNRAVLVGDDIAERGRALFGSECGRQHARQPASVKNVIQHKRDRIRADETRPTMKASPSPSDISSGAFAWRIPIPL